MTGWCSIQCIWRSISYLYIKGILQRRFQPDFIFYFCIISAYRYYHISIINYDCPIPRVEEIPWIYLWLLCQWQMEFSICTLLEYWSLLVPVFNSASMWAGFGNGETGQKVWGHGMGDSPTVRNIPSMLLTWVLSLTQHGPASISECPWMPLNAAWMTGLIQEIAVPAWDHVPKSLYWISVPLGWELQRWQRRGMTLLRTLGILPLTPQIIDFGSESSHSNIFERSAKNEVLVGHVNPDRNACNWSPIPPE